MPLFDFKCNACNHELELICSFESSESELPCTEMLESGDICKGHLIKQVSAPGGLDFRGLGCYKVEKYRK